MNAIKKILAINEKELLQNVPDAASWHADYSDTPYIYIGNLHEDLKEKDIVIIFSQYGNPTHVNLVKDRESGILRGFCYLKYEDHRSCALAIDNFNGVKVYERPLKVDHTYYRLVEGQSEDDFLVEYPKTAAITEKSETHKEQVKPKLLEFHNTDDLSQLDDENFEDPMANFKPEPTKRTKSTKSSESSKRHRSEKHESRLEKHDRHKRSHRH